MKQPLKILLFLFLFFMLMMIVVEALLTVAFVIKDRNIQPMAVRDYPYLYYLFEDTGDETNHDGLKTTALKEKNPETYRIIITGGSLVRGRQPDQTISAYLEKILNQQDFTGFSRVEVINAGMSAYTIQQEFLLLQMVLQHYQPDMVISISGYNDMYTSRLHYGEELPHPLPPHNWENFKVMQQNRRTGTVAGRAEAAFSSIFRVVRYVREKLSLPPEVEKSQLNEPQTYAEKRAVEAAVVYHSIIQDMEDFCRGKDIQFLHVLQPVQIDTSTQHGKYGEIVYNELQDLFNQTSQPKSLDFTWLFDQKPQLYLDEVHVTSEGHREIAEEVAKAVLSLPQHEIKTN